jgi:hypothetical protein
MGKVKKDPLTLTLSRGVEREKEQNFLKKPLTLVFSRKRREELKEYALTLALSRGVERKDEKKRS